MILPPFRLDRLIYAPVIAAIAGIWIVGALSDFQERDDILQQAQSHLSLSVATLMDANELAEAAAGTSADQKSENRTTAIWRALLRYPTASIWIEKDGVVVAGETPRGNLDTYVVADEERGSFVSHAALPKADALVTWQRSIVMDSGIVLAASLGLLFLTYLLAGSLRQRAVAEEATVSAIRHLLLRDRALEAISQGITIVDHGIAGDPIIYTNQAFSTLTQYTADEIKGRNPFSFFDPATSAAIEQGVAKAREGKKIWRMEVPIQRKDGSTFLDSITDASIMNDEGKITHSVTVHDDVTEDHRRERQLREMQKLESVGHLTGGIAHEFNNLLAVITTNAEDLRDHLQPEPDYAEQAAMVLQAANRGADLVKQLLVFSRKQELEPQVIDINDHLKLFAKLLGRTLPENIATDVLLMPQPLSLHLDPALLDAALLNLALNARDAMPAGGKIVIETSVSILDEEYAALHSDVSAGKYVLISVSDTGVGMPGDVLKHAFEPFFTTKEVGKGTGLGLSMVYGFVKQSGGHASIYSEPGFGTTVRIYLPLTAETAPATGKPDFASHAVQGGTGRILLVEDDDLVRASVGTKLRHLGYEVTDASMPAKAIILLQKSPHFDLVFSDVIMPGSQTGADLAREVQVRWPTMKVLLTSGYTVAAVRSKVEMPPGVALLSKPYSNAELAIAVREAIGLRETAPLTIAL